MGKCELSPPCAIKSLLSENSAVSPVATTFTFLLGSQAGRASSRNWTRQGVTAGWGHAAEPALDFTDWDNLLPHHLCCLGAQALSPPSSTPFTVSKVVSPCLLSHQGSSPHSGAPLTGLPEIYSDDVTPVPTTAHELLRVTVRTLTGPSNRPVFSGAVKLEYCLHR